VHSFQRPPSLRLASRLKLSSRARYFLISIPVCRELTLLEATSSNPCSFSSPPGVACAWIHRDRGPATATTPRCWRRHREKQSRQLQLQLQDHRTRIDKSKRPIGYCITNSFRYVLVCVFVCNFICACAFGYTVKVAYLQIQIRLTLGSIQSILTRSSSPSAQSTSSHPSSSVKSLPYKAKKRTTFLKLLKGIVTVTSVRYGNRLQKGGRKKEKTEKKKEKKEEDWKMKRSRSEDNHGECLSPSLQLRQLTSTPGNMLLDQDLDQDLLEELLKSAPFASDFSHQKENGVEERQNVVYYISFPAYALIWMKVNLNILSNRNEHGRKRNCQNQNYQSP
jgi:hypothetical protein